MPTSHTSDSPHIRMIECSRDAMQGWTHIISTSDKVRYINSLLQVGFDTLDFGSFVSPKAIPQMADTKEVITRLDMAGSKTRLLAIVANVRGAMDAAKFEQINCIGFPFSVSPTFQLRNTNSTMDESLNTIDAIQECCIKNNKELVVYLSMGFGNPYGDAYNEEILLNWAGEMVKKQVRILSLADTVGVATPVQISNALRTMIPVYSGTEIGVHLHSTVGSWQGKLKAALDAGCRRFDGALKGIGGCPMAQNELVGNMDTELMIPYFEKTGFSGRINNAAFQHSLAIADEIFV